MRKYCDGEKIDLEILMDLLYLSPSEGERVVFGVLSIGVYGCVPEWADAFCSYSALKSLSVRSLPSAYEISCFKR
jgi:hypothetical protein